MNNHQYYNAKEFEKSNRCFIFDENNLSAELLSNYYMFLMKLKVMELTDSGIQGLILWLNK